MIMAFALAEEYLLSEEITNPISRYNAQTARIHNGNALRNGNCLFTSLETSI